MHAPGRATPAVTPTRAHSTNSVARDDKVRCPFDAWQAGVAQVAADSAEGRHPELTRDAALLIAPLLVGIVVAYAARPTVAVPACGRARTPAACRYGPSLQASTDGRFAAAGRPCRLQR